jgi:hypothetical protein
MARKSMKKIISLLFILMSLLSACAPAAKTAEPVQAKSTGLFQIIKPDGSKFDVTLDAVKKLTPAQITVEGKVQEGPKLLDILSLAGVTEFTEITITGGSAPSTLKREQVDDNTILDFSNRGTMKLATTYIPKAEWTKDISEITVK